MRSYHRICTFAMVLATSFNSVASSPLAPGGNHGGQFVTTQTKKIVIPFDFESRFDNGDYGQNIGEMFWTKLRRQGGFILPESMQDVRDWCQCAGNIPGPDTSLSRMKEIVAKEQAGDIGIWGKVERVAGFETDGYDLWISVADFSVDPPLMIYQKKARTRTVGEIAQRLCQGSDRCSLRPARAGRHGPRPHAPRTVEQGTQSRARRFRARSPGAPRLESAACRCHLGARDGHGRKSEEPRDPLHPE